MDVLFWKLYYHFCVIILCLDTYCLNEQKQLTKPFFLGWRPRRSIVLCSWGGEEYGLLGSTEWVEVCNADNLVLVVLCVTPCYS